jgi:hypothetical protein
LEQVFAEKHEYIKDQVENYIQIEHHNEKNCKETKQKLNLLKIENEKYSELTNVLSTPSTMQKRRRRPSATGTTNSLTFGYRAKILEMPIASLPI